MMYTWKKDENGFLINPNPKIEEESKGTVSFAMEQP